MTQEKTAELEESFVTPPVTICETQDEVILEADMPGVDRSHLDVAVDGDDLVITGRRPTAPASGEMVWQEIPRHNFRRTFALGDHINRSAISAAFQDGVLTLKLGKTEDVKPQKINVQFN